MKKVILLLSALAFLALGSLNADHHKGDLAPSTLIHVVTVTWKPEATEAQIQAALDGVKTLGKEFDGITRVWTKTVKAQGDRTHAFVMEFKSEAALKEYAGSDAQKKWYEVYIPYRKRSTTFDITN
ncbi:MAG: Dabb family protein [Opitutales bacterium]